MLFASERGKTIMAEHGRIHFGTIIDAPASRVWPLLRDFRWTFMKMPETTVALKVLALGTWCILNKI